MDGRWFLASDPGPRAWFSNLSDNPRFTFHLKNGLQADLPATATLITDQSERRRILDAIITESDRRGQDQSTRSVEDWVARSPLVEIHFEDMVGVDDS